jgi:hypothetical protein
VRELCGRLRQPYGAHLLAARDDERASLAQVGVYIGREGENAAPPISRQRWQAT